MTDAWLSDIFDGVSVLVVLVLALVVITWIYLHRILKRLDRQVQTGKDPKA